MKIRNLYLGGMLGVLFLLAACASRASPPSDIPGESAPEGERGVVEAPPERGYRIVTLLPPDAIPAIDNPVFLSAEKADAEYAPDEMVLGVVFDGEARAYSVPMLSSHEIVNDTVGGKKIAVTW